MADKAPDPFNEWLQSMSEAETAEWSCRALIRSLMLPRADESPETRAALDYARRTLEAGAESLLQRVAALENEDERIDAFADIEFLVEGAIRITIGSSSPEIQSGSPAAPLEAIAADNAARRRAGRPLGARAPIIAALRKLYPDGDPVEARGMHREVLRSYVAKEIGVPVESVDMRTMDRARQAAWSSVHV